MKTTKTRKAQRPAVVLVDLEQDLRRRLGRFARPGARRMTRQEEQEDLARLREASRRHDEQLGPRSLVKPRLRKWPRCPDPKTATISQWLRYSLDNDRRSCRGLAQDSGVAVGKIESFMIPPGRPGHRDLTLGDAGRLCQTLGLRLVAGVVVDNLPAITRREERERILEKIQAR